MALDQNFFEDKPWWQALVYGLIVAIIIILFSEFLWPNFRQMRTNIQSQKAEFDALSAEIEKGRAAERKLAQFREQVKTLELQLAKLLTVLPPEKDTETLIKNVETLVHQGDFNLLSFKTDKPVPKEFYKEYPFDVALTGSYNNLALFFQRMSNFSRIINVEGLKITGIPSAASGPSLNATFVAKTFIYTGDEEQANPSAGGTGTPNGNVARGVNAIKNPTQGAPE